MRHALAIGAVVAILGSSAGSAGLQDALDLYAGGDIAGAAAIYGDLAQEGDARAQFNLALMFYVGQGVPQSYYDAYVWAWRAKLKGVAQAQILIDRVENGISRDERIALADTLMGDLSEGIANGDARAMLAMSVIQSDLLPKPDMIQTYVWQSMSVAIGLSEAETLRDATFDQLSDRDKVRAQTAARDTFSQWCGEVSAANASCRVFQSQS